MIQFSLLERGGHPSCSEALVGHNDSIQIENSPATLSSEKTLSSPLNEDSLNDDETMGFDSKDGEDQMLESSSFHFESKVEEPCGQPECGRDNSEPISTLNDIFPDDSAVAYGQPESGGNNSNSRPLSVLNFPDGFSQSDEEQFNIQNSLPASDLDDDDFEDDSAVAYGQPESGGNNSNSGPLSVFADILSNGFSQSDEEQFNIQNSLPASGLDDAYYEELVVPYSQPESGRLNFGSEPISIFNDIFPNGLSPSNHELNRF